MKSEQIYFYIGKCSKKCSKRLQKVDLYGWQHSVELLNIAVLNSFAIFTGKHLPSLSLDTNGLFTGLRGLAIFFLKIVQVRTDRTTSSF